MATRTLSSETPDKPPPDPPADDTPEAPPGHKIGPGGELYGDAHTTPEDEVIYYPDDQDGIVVG